LALLALVGAAIYHLNSAWGFIGLVFLKSYQDDSNAQPSPQGE